MSIATQATPSNLADALRGIEWDAEHGTLDVGRYRMPYAVWGEGPPLLFVHGLADTLRSSALVMAELTQEYQCIAYQQPTGDGDGARLPSYRHEHLTDDLFALLNHLKVAQATVVAHSYGTTIALRAMHQRPFRLPRALLVCGLARRPLSGVEWMLAQMGRVLGGRMRHAPMWKPVVHLDHHRSFANQAEDVWQFLLSESGRAPMKSVAHWARELHHLDLRPLLAQIRQATLVVSGDHDPLVPLSIQEELFCRLPNGSMFQIDGCGHFPLLTHPHAIADAVRRFAPPLACPFHGMAGMATH